MNPFRRRPSSIVDAISERFSGNEDRPSFLRGLALGALVGAAIAGSTLWSRFRSRRVAGGRSTDGTADPS